MKSETIRIPGVHYTLKQLLDMDRVPVPGNPGETRWNNRYCQIETTYWNIADTVVVPFNHPCVYTVLIGYGVYYSTMHQFF